MEWTKAKASMIAASKRSICWSIAVILYALYSGHSTTDWADMAWALGVGEWMENVNWQQIHRCWMFLIWVFGDEHTCINFWWMAKVWNNGTNLASNECREKNMSKKRCKKNDMFILVCEGAIYMYMVWVWLIELSKKVHAKWPLKRTDNSVEFVYIW